MKRDFLGHELRDVPTREPFDLLVTGDLANSLRAVLQHLNYPNGLRLEQRRRAIRDVSMWTRRLENFTGSLNVDLFAKAGTMERMRHLIRCLVVAEALV